MNLNGEKVNIRLIEKNDMPFVQELWGNEETMLAAGGAYKLKTEDFEKLFHILRKEDDSVNNHYIIETKDKLIGDISVRKFIDTSRVAQIDMKIDSSERNRGYAKEALELYLNYFFNEIKGNEIVFELWLHNYFVQHKLEDYGFVATFIAEDSNIMSINKDIYLTSILNKKGGAHEI